jgi:phosphoribosylformimino-5-aminoimidazole carboxamide ribonucleotide (ProFAR) isomerase
LLLAVFRLLDLEQLAKIDASRLDGVIIGKALYEASSNPGGTRECSLSESFPASMLKTAAW